MITMKKLVILFLILTALTLSLLSCTSTTDELPSGRASEVRIENGDSYWDLGSGNFRYINETTIEFIRDYDGKTLYLSTSTLIDIIVE